MPGAWLLDCAGSSEDEIASKRDGTWVNPMTGRQEKTCPATAEQRRGTCAPTAATTRSPSCGLEAYLSTDPRATLFACDYGTSTQDCNPRTQDAYTDIHCARNSNDPDGSCHDSCWVDADGNVVPHQRGV